MSRSGLQWVFIAMTNSVGRWLADVAADAGVGMLAGLVGTAAMTVSSTVEMKLTGREASTTTVDAAGAVLGVKPVDDAAAGRFGNVVHWGYGAGWGAVRGLLAAVGLRRPAVGGVVHFGLVWGSEQAVLPATGAGKPVWSYGGAAAVTDGLHHAIYAAVTSWAFAWLDRRRSGMLTRRTE